MSRSIRILKKVATGLSSSPHLANVIFSSELSTKRGRLDVDVQSPVVSSTINFGVHLVVKGDSLQLIAKSRNSEGKRLLRNVLVSRARLRSTPVEHLVLEEDLHGGGADAILRLLVGWVQEIRSLLLTWEQVVNGDLVTPEDSVLGFWWDGKANFGDAAGPWLINKMTGKNVINARNSRAIGVATPNIGSLFQMINYPRVDFWGCGLLYPPNERQVERLRSLEQARIFAVRGEKTRETLQQMVGWEVPAVYGDPALLFPRYLQIEQRGHAAGVALIPHRQHSKYFDTRDIGNVELLSVADDVREVVTSIATSEVCVSTSLHGVIFAQAYGVPWVWLNVQDDELKGGEFKFEDFFTTIDRDAVSRVDVSTHDLLALDVEDVATRAALPETLIDLDMLERSFPISGD